MRRSSPNTFCASSSCAITNRGSCLRSVGVLGLLGALLLSGLVPGFAAAGSPDLTRTVAHSLTADSPGGAEAGSLTSWHNVSANSTGAPASRSLSQAAFSPPLNATVLFGGYNGAGGNFPLGDTWMYQRGEWTERSEASAPAPRWGGAMVYDPAAGALVLFGGRNDTSFFNDTWEFNASGWSHVTTGPAPSPRYDFGMVYDSVLGGIVLFGGATGNVPAGTFSNFVYYTDTWTFEGGHWSNITSTAGVPPAGRLIRGQMAYDAIDGYSVLIGGFQFAPFGGTCGLATFSAADYQTSIFNGSQWSTLRDLGPSPPAGIGAVWYDSDTNSTLYYLGLHEGSRGTCGVSGTAIWSYSTGNWTLVTEGNISSPTPRIMGVFLDDLGDRVQLEFGGEAATGTEYAAGYLSDTWTYRPAWATFDAQGWPSGTQLTVHVGGLSNSSSAGTPLVIVDAPGPCVYDYSVRVNSAVISTGVGAVDLRQGPVAIVLVYQGQTVPTVVFSMGALVSSLAGAVVGAGAVAGGLIVLSVGRTARLRREGEQLSRAMVSEESPEGGPRRP